MPRLFTEEFIQKRKQLNFNYAQLKKKTVKELKEICQEYGLSKIGAKSTLINSILNAKNEDQHYLSRKRQFEDRVYETRMLKKRKFTETGVTLCKICVPSHIFLHIMQYIIQIGNRNILNTYGLVNQEWYVNIRSPVFWKTIRLRAKFAEFIPVPMLHECEKLYLKDEFSAKQIKYLFSNAKKVEQIHASGCIKN